MTAKPAAEAKAKKKSEGVTHLTEAEATAMEGNTLPPAGYANTTLKDPATVVAETTAVEPAVKVEEKKAEVIKPAAEPKAEPVVAPAASPNVSDDTFSKLERELVKPEGKENLEDFSPREKAYFHQMRRDRKARQRAEEERDAALFRETKAKEPPPVDPLEGKDDDDILSVKEARALLANNKKDAPPPAQPNLQALRYLQMCEKESRSAHDDFDAVMELSDELVAGDAQALKEISEATQRGENPAEAMYAAVKRHKEFETLLPAAELRAKAKKTSAAPPSASTPSAPAATPTPEEQAKVTQAKQAEAALEKNANQTRTTAHVSAREGKPAEELTLEEISSMRDSEFSKLPKHVRQRYLKQYGGN